MWGMAARLTDAQIAMIADYYATQRPVDGDAKSKWVRLPHRFSPLGWS
jgi:cytochrome c553